MLFFRLTQNYQNVIKKCSEDYYQFTNKNHCLRCGQQFENGICNACQEFGVITSETILYQLPYKEYDLKEKIQMPKISLTPLQQEASKYILKNSTKKEVLIWAVCGSGKTEITYEIILKYINQKQYVAFVIPRKDIIEEIAKRLEQSFIGIDLVLMSSDHKKKRDGQMYILTPNQLLRFKNAFSLIICDEIDAYPFMEDPRFIYAVETARRSESATCFLTSTPSGEFLKRDLAIFTIYERWHQYDLPEPQLVYQNVKLLKWGRIRPDLKLILLSERQCLVFIGKISLGHALLKTFRKWDKNCELVYAMDEKRQEKIRAFRKGKIKILLTTTILERGVTFSGIDVIVIDADSPVYQISSLVQIAGRVNRKIDDQQGQVIFCYEKPSKTIEKACEQIAYMNQKKANKTSSEHNK